MFLVTYPQGLSVNTIQLGWSSVRSTNCTQVKFSQCRMACKEFSKLFRISTVSVCPRRIQTLPKKCLSCSCYSSTWVYHFIFIVRKCTFFVNNIDKAFTWDVRTLDFLDLALKLSLPQLFP